MENKVVVYDLNDDRECEGFKSEHGLSLLVSAFGHNILFDAGQTENYKFNAQNLGLDLSSIDCIVLSHGHYDHGNGLSCYEKKNTKLYMHPNCLSNRIRKSTNTYGGISLSITEIKDRFDLTQTDKPTQIFDNIYFLGEIERKFDFEAKKFPTKNSDGSDDKAPDDSGIAINTESGIIVITGCGHSGICNTIEFAKKVTNNNKVKAVIGGFHLKEVDDYTMKTIEYFKNNDIEQIAVGHCTSNAVCEEFQRQLPQTTVLHSGKIIKFNM